MSSAVGTGTRILYLDDEEALVFLMTRMLEHLGYRAAGYTLAADALLAFQNEPETFSLVMTDLAMPRVSGLEFAQAILAIRPDTAVAIATGFADPRDVEAARTIGVLEVVVKPHTIEDMAQTVGALLKKANALKQADT